MPKSAICSYTKDSSTKKTYEDSSWSTRTEIVLVKTRCTSSASSPKRKQEGRLPSLTCSPYSPQAMVKAKQLPESCRKQRKQACKAAWLQNDNGEESIVLPKGNKTIKRHAGNLTLLEKLDRLELNEKMTERAYHTLLRNSDSNEQVNEDAKKVARSMLLYSKLSKSTSLEEKHIDIDGKQTKRPKKTRRFSTCSMPKLIQGIQNDVTTSEQATLHYDTGMDTPSSRASKLMTDLSLESLTNLSDRNEVLSSTPLTSIASRHQIKGDQEINLETEFMDPAFKPNRLKMRAQRYSTGMCPDFMKFASDSTNNTDSVERLCSLPGSLSSHHDNEIDDSLEILSFLQRHERLKDQAKRKEICSKKRKLSGALSLFAVKDSSSVSH